MAATRIVLRDPRLRLRCAEVEDEPFLRDLFKAVKGAQFAAGGLPSAMLDLVLAQQYQAQTAGYAAQFPTAQSLLVLEDAAPVGRLLLDCRAGRWHVVDIALTPAVRNRGIGQGVMMGVIAAARTEGAPAVTLTMLRTNAGARRFYGRLGFTEASADSTASHLTMHIVTGG
ncbi:GNAT family N-acetyltransferase [Bradyrhizobium oligotrophicum]|uniref:GNAT family N-acetyltransferase n=1 Tax=Bradyrhizobium oligotrophicum TaxID=44255 RepID=UPI001FCB7808|nr:GNAT family N-acetyltransferase [Bradyrhizobium oligotrophicum]